MTHSGSPRTEGTGQEFCMRLNQEMFIYFMAMLFGVLLGLLTVRVEVVSDSFASFEDTFLSTGLPYSALI